MSVFVSSHDAEEDCDPHSPPKEIPTMSMIIIIDSFEPQ
jgi:hypothetical protein